jgi:DNA-binding MarR family transcriptional regulator
MSSPHASDDDLRAFEQDFVAFVRSFGLLDGDTTPCGQRVPVSHAHALSQIAAQPGLSQQELAVELGLARATISELVAQLETRGWVLRSADPRDRRLRRLSLTPAGARMASEIQTARSTHLRRLLDAIDTAHRAETLRGVRALARAARATREAIMNSGAAHS